MFPLEKCCGPGSCKACHQIKNGHFWWCFHPYAKLRHCIITARKRSLRQGNVFTGVCLSMGGEVLPDRDLPWTDTPWTEPPRMVKSGQYASYWNAFLLQHAIKIYCPKKVRLNCYRPPMKLRKRNVFFFQSCLSSFLFFFGGGYGVPCDHHHVAKMLSCYLVVLIKSYLNWYGYFCKN